MSSSFPKFQIFASDGSTLVYSFDAVTDWGEGPLSDPVTFIEHTSLRGQGSIISEGSNEPWDFTLTFRLSANDYESLFSKMKDIKDTVIFNTKYILKIDRTSGGATEDLKVKRLQPIRFPVTSRTQKVVTSQQGIITFRVDSWS